MMRDPLGGFEREVLTAIRQEPDPYGAIIAKRIANNTGRKPTIGAVYTTLERIERKGYVVSKWGEPTAIRGGRRKRFYSITPDGEKLLQFNENNGDVID